MKQTKSNLFKQSDGFTLIELIVALSILGILVGLVTVNFGGLRIDRNLTIAQNELVTNLRKVQAYTLSSRVVGADQPGQFYILKFDSANPTHYVLQTMYNITATPTPPTLVPSAETYVLPPGVQVSSTPVTIYRSKLPTTQTTACSLVAFKTPFAKVYLNSGCNFVNFNSGDDYQGLINYVTNVDNIDASTDSTAIINLTDNTGKYSRQVMVRGATGIICPTTDGVNCSQ
ncbi:MAG: prepilin-type N-terminal cleavage/methylation domain-containing protein [Patescibacteria group bacterium]|nr:prepilin-type N-terminal cleavage/methylation domain-containing protein [Patescibacteria group bacterium]